MKAEIDKLIEEFKEKTLNLPTVLLLSPEDLAELREEMGIAPEEDFRFYKSMTLLVIPKEDEAE